MGPPRLPANIYGEQIYKAGHGYGLYEPEREVYPGDVGFLSDGGVMVLFNVTLDGNDPRQTLGVPDGFEKLDLPQNMWKRNPEWHTQPVPITSETGQRRVVGVNATADIAATGGQFQFAYTSVCGAALVTRYPASREDILLQSRLARNYIVNNIDSWYAFADEKGYDLEEGELFLVRGCDKTAAWSLAVFSGSARGVSFEFRGGYPGVASAGLLMSGQWYNLPNYANQRSGPGSHMVPSSSVAHANALNASSHDAYGHENPPHTTHQFRRHDQTLFVRIWKIKRRSWPFPHKLEAMAESQNLRYGGSSSHRDNQSISTSSTTVKIPRDYSLFDLSLEASDKTEDSEYGGGILTASDLTTSKGYVNHPLDTILDYILEKSTCSVAIADDDDFYKLFTYTSKMGTNMGEALEILLPEVRVSENSLPGNHTIGFINHVGFVDPSDALYIEQANTFLSAAPSSPFNSFAEPGIIKGNEQFYPKHAEPFQSSWYTPSGESNDKQSSYPSSKTGEQSTNFEVVIGDHNEVASNADKPKNRSKGLTHKHACPNCGKRFRDVCGLNDHRNGVHLEMKPHKCVYCGRGFSRSSDRKRHMENICYARLAAQLGKPREE